MRADCPLRVVIDTNVWISAALSRQGAPAQVVRLVLANGVAVVSPVTFEELRTRLWKPKFDRYLSLEARQQLLHDLNAAALWVDIPMHLATQRFSRDPDDDAFVQVALAASAVWLVSGDDDLLSLTPPPGLCILSPASALADDRFMKV